MYRSASLETTAPICPFSAGRLETLKRLARENVRERWRDPKARYAKAIDEVNTRDHPYWRPASLADVDTFDAAASADDDANKLLYAPRIQLGVPVATGMPVSRR